MGGLAEAEIDLRDDKAFPRRGARFLLGASGYPAIWDSEGFAQGYLTASGYWNRISNLVVLTEQELPVPGCGGGTVQCIQYANVTTPMTALGAEAELRWQAGRWAARGNPTRPSCGRPSRRCVPSAPAPPGTNTAPTANTWSAWP